jgi:hypothetical protein
MVESVLEKSVCQKCGVDRRDGTTYCYNCGARVIDETETGLDPEKTLVIKPIGGDASDGSIEKQPDPKERVTRAAKERKKARVTSRKPVEYRWEPTDDVRLPLVGAVLLTIIVAVIAGLMVFWK